MKVMHQSSMVLTTIVILSCLIIFFTFPVHGVVFSFFQGNGHNNHLYLFSQFVKPDPNSGDPGRGQSFGNPRGSVLLIAQWTVSYVHTNLNTK